MGCEIIGGKLSDGTPWAGFACGSRRKAPKCSYCDRPHTKLCDFKQAIEGGWKVCDKRICDPCSVKKGADVDHCRIHALRGDRELA